MNGANYNYSPDIEVAVPTPFSSNYKVGTKTLELSNHTSTPLSACLGNVLSVITDNVWLNADANDQIIDFSPDIVSVNDYYLLRQAQDGAFGMIMPGRSYNSGDYRYGFNGMEKDDEVKGSGNHVDYGARVYDPRIAIWLKVDPRSADLPGYSPYAFAVGNPILYLDPDGEYPISIHVRSFAPFSSFGPGNLWEGDGSNRSFTTNPAGSRISMVTHYETETQVANSKAFGAMSFSKYGARAYSNAYLNKGQRSVTSTGNSLDLHLYGKNEAFLPPASPIGWSPGGRYTPTSDIDIHNRLTIDATDGVLSISGQISGDQFPSAEAFVTDDFGTSIFLGVAPTSGGRQFGPVKDLAGDRDLPMIDVNVRISVGEDGAFQGVYSQDSDGNETIISPDAWNKQYESQSTTR